MMTVSRKLRHQDYTVAWICALPLEMAAAVAMLDERHRDLPAKANDSNTYILGRIHGHNVAIACLPSGVYGTTSAAIVGIQMQSTFESIRFGLMIGIGGGVPSGKADIRLGDVVVSKPTRDSGGVIQYDYGKTVAGGRFERTGVLNKPPPVLLTAISRLQAEHNLKPSRIPALISEAMDRNPEMREKFTYRGEDQDILFDSEYDHTGSEDNCDNCYARKLVTRPTRPNHDPVIHYGLIASGNQVVKHGRSRDNMARELDILCFEMEAAGLMDNFPCLVVRGICDYSDSHKNKQWQEYAALTAAAYGKEFLSVVHASHVVNTLPAGSLSEISHCKERPSYTANFPTKEVAVRNDGLTKDEILERISSYDYERIHRRLTQKRLAGTTRWFLDHQDFNAWFTEKEISSLWCSGKIGSGKTMIATAVIDAAKHEHVSPSPTIFFYCETENHTAFSASDVLSSFIRQLCEFTLHRDLGGNFASNVSEDIYRFFGDKRVQPDLEDLKHIFTLCFRSMPDTVYVVDGLDALDREHAKFLLQVFKSLFHHDFKHRRKSRILLLTRDQVPGYINISTFIPGIRQVSTTANVMEDIGTYIESTITDKTMSRRLTDDPLLMQEIQQRLLTESSGMFLWVYLQLEILWDTCYTDAEIRSAISALPEGLEDTYGRCVERINFEDSRALKVLKWVSFATRPLHIEELREAIAFDLKDTMWNPEKIPRKEYVIGCCANLIIVDSTDDCVRFAHSSVKQYLEKNRETNMQWYPTPAQGVLECGESCIAYLSFSDFSLQLSTRREERAEVPVSPPILLAQQTLPRLFTKRFLYGSRNQTRPISLPFFREIRTSSTPDQTRFKFLTYAVTSWALQTKEISRTSSSWEKFEQLALCFNETWNFHPWAPGGRSVPSRLHSLFGWAVKEQHEPLLSVAQGAGADLQRVCDLPLIDESLPALHLAARLGYNRMIEVLLGICNPNSTDLDGYTALHHAASRGHLQICQVLSRAKQTKLNAPSIFQCTPLWLAASNGHNNVVSLLTSPEIRANIEAKDSSFKQTPLSRAARNGHDAVVEVLLDRGAHLESEDAYGRTPLWWAIEGWREPIIEMLLKKGASIDIDDIDMKRLLTWATKNGHDAIVYSLSRKIVNFNVRSNRDPGLLLWAAQNGHETLASLLLEKGVDIEVKDDTWGQTPLSWSAENGYEGLVMMLLAKGASMETRDKKLDQTPLLWAVKNNHKDVANLLLKKGADTEVKDGQDGQTPLIWAVKNNHEAMAHLLLESGADIEAKDGQVDRTPLFWAIENGHETMVTLLLERNVDIKVPNGKDGLTPLSWAAKNGYEVVVYLLIEKGADIEAKDDKGGRTPLWWAARKGHEGILMLLLEKGAHTEIKDGEFGQTPLSRAAENGHDAVVKLLLEKGADTEVKDGRFGRTPLWWAARKGHEVIVILLLRKGVNTETKDDECGQTPLSRAAEDGNDFMAQLLLDNGADIEARDSEYGRTPLSWAATTGHISVVKLLLKNGAEIDIKDQRFGQTPLSLAAKNGHEAVVRLLLEKGADIEARDLKYSQTPLSLAARNGHEAVVKLLSENGAEVDVKDQRFGQTPLSFAAEYGHEAVVKVLLEKDANIEARDFEYSRRPLSWAAEYGHQVVVRLLLEKSAKSASVEPS
ncbi:hypothetical protein N7528_002542 [Penicillium herquei]|nr:hypothetical protein N7528_002542 [Penicillium herquei]